MTEEFTGPQTKIEITMTKDGETHTIAGDRPTAEVLAADMPAEMKQLEQDTGAKVSSVKVAGVEVHKADDE